MVTESSLHPLLGINVDPSASDPNDAFQRARIADESGLDLITIQDHPYNLRFLETWTLLTAVAMKTERVHLGTNVLSTPLRPPAMLAKKAATLDVLSGGRLELGLGAGAYLPGIQAYGGRAGSSQERYRAFKEVVEIIRGMWANSGGSFSYTGDFHKVKGARPGPAPAHPIRLWFGATGPSMLRLTGRLADGLLISTSYVPKEKLPDINRLVDEGAAQAGRSPQDVRRGYNLMGVLDLNRPDTKLEEGKPGYIFGDSNHWIEQIVRLYRDYRQDTFIFWPVSGNEMLQIEIFAREIAPAIRERLIKAG